MHGTVQHTVQLLRTLMITFAYRICGVTLVSTSHVWMLRENIQFII